MFYRYADSKLYIKELRAQAKMLVKAGEQTYNSFDEQNKQ